MPARPPVLAAVTLALAACAGGGPAPLGYGLPNPAQVTYAYGDTTIVSVSAMGQSMEIAMRGSADYGIAFSDAPDGVGVTLTVQALEGSISQPMGEAQAIDETDVEGELVFSLDRMGNATVTQTPQVSAGAGRMISALTTAQTFFPGLPNRVVATGDTWTDTISYEGDAELGATTEESVILYTVVGDTTVAGRSLMKIALEGTTSLSNSMDMGGMQIQQSSNVDVEGHVLWDASAGIMYEVVRAGTGRGTVRVPIAPTPFPIELTISQRATLQDGM